VQPMRRNPLARALRVDKLTLAALTATLRIYQAGVGVEDEIPVFKMIARPIRSVRGEARRLARRLASTLGEHGDVEVVEGMSAVGGGSLPGQVIPTYLVALRIAHKSAAWLADWLRSHDPPIIARIEGDRVVFDVRTLQRGEGTEIIAAASRLREELGAH
jgi:L-seryl-tRNA(Ser) seleniumtransferase